MNEIKHIKEDLRGNILEIIHLEVNKSLVSPKDTSDYREDKGEEP